MALHLYNTKTRQKEIFEPLNPQQVKMYVCGPTVYNFIHIGNARPVVVFDVLFRVLRHLYPDVVYARNITDIDDKIMKAAKENNESIESLAARYAAFYAEDTASLKALPPTLVPYATHHVDDMISMVQKLVERGHAYVAEGHVLFDVKSMPDYGCLSNRSLEDMLEGARVEVAPYKRYGGDFVLWKPSNDDDPGWTSPWGRGRPGWHLECSAMIEKLFGDTIDIHGGGRDLIFPHHENELAQSHCAHGGTEYVRYWMHNGFLNIDGEKMAKSLGNFRTVRELLNEFPGEVLRFALLSAQYRSELDFSAELLQQSKAALDTLYGALRKFKQVPATPVDLSATPVFAALMDDLNTPLAISELHQLAKQMNKQDDKDEGHLKSVMVGLGAVLGLLQDDPDEWFQGESGSLSANQIQALIDERHQAKLDKNYARADEIRAILKSHSIELEDNKNGSIWRRI